ncbi:MAG: ATP-binding protein [bacterium]
MAVRKHDHQLANYAWKLLLPFVLPALLLLIALVLLWFPGDDAPVPLIVTLLVIASLVALTLAMVWLTRTLLAPMVKLEQSVAQVAEGSPEAVLPKGNTGFLDGLVTDISRMSEELTEVYEDLDDSAIRQTTRLAQKTAALKILYDVAASVNQMSTTEDLLVRYLRVLKEMVNGMSASARIFSADGKTQLVACIGLDDKLLLAEAMLPLDICRCGVPLSPGDILCTNQSGYCRKQLGRTMYGSDEIRELTVPMEHQGKLLGEFHVYIRLPGVFEREDIIELLDSIGSHLGMAIAKQRSDEEARRLSIIEERNSLAHELHDSLAQTLAGLRFQGSMLEDSLKQQLTDETASKDLTRLRSGIDEAHTELRALLTSFRAPVDQRGLVRALERMLERYGSETGIASYFQPECQPENLDPSEETQMLRIVQEALANVRKHAEAHTVRVLLSCRADGALMLLIEDDGLGFEEGNRRGHPGEHIGLSIMEERAQRLGGELKVESEPGEGTRVELWYKPQSAEREPRNRWDI